MENTETDSKKKSQQPAKQSVEMTRSSESGTPSVVETETPSITLSKDLARSLMGLIRDVNKDDVTPESVNASCNCAAQIYKILRLNFEMKKEGF